MPEKKPVGPSTTPKGKGGPRLKRGTASYYSRKYGETRTVNGADDPRMDWGMRQLPTGDKDDD